MQFTTVLSAVIGLLVASTQATHQLGSSCSSSEAGTFGCSNDECTVIECSTSGNGKFYWQYSESCIGIKCENGACDPNFVKTTCNT